MDIENIPKIEQSRGGGYMAVIAECASCGAVERYDKSEVQKLGTIWNAVYFADVTSN